MENKIVILGAGYAGVLTAKKLAKKFKKNDKVSVTIIDKNPFHTMLTELHEVAANRVDEDSIKMGLKKIFAGRKVEVVVDTINSIDLENNFLIGSNGRYSYDYLVLASGSKPTYFGVTGAAEYSFKLWSYNDAIRIREHIHDSFRKASLETNTDKKKKLLSFYIVGAGFTGVEMAGELAEYLPILCEKYEIDRQLAAVFIVDILERTVPILPEKLSNKVEKRLVKMGVGIMLDTSVCGIGPDYIEIKRNGDCIRQVAGTVIWAAGIEGSDISVEASKTLESENRGRIKVDPYLRSTDDEHVYVVGDNMFYIAEGEDNPVPQMVENCEQSSAIAAKNIYISITGEGEMIKYKPSFHGVMVSVGGRYGVARVGLPNHMFSLPSFLAMLSKHFINVIYFIQVLGWNKVFSYLKHEFFTIRNCRSFLGGHFSNRTPSFLMVPLRIWLGAVWVFEGVMKIIEGWFTSPKLTDFFGAANTWYNSIINSTTGTSGVVSEAGKAAADAVSSATTSAGAVETGKAVVDAVTTATGAAPEAVGTAIINFNFLDLVHVIFVSGKTLAQSTLNDYAFKLDIPIINWFVNHWILPNSSMQIFMQVSIIIAEILIGLALIGGLVTTPASALSLILQFMFVCTTGLYLGTLWMVFAGIAVLVGAGRTFGLDYYFMPYLKRKWKRLPIVGRLYIYND